MLILKQAGSALIARDSQPIGVAGLLVSGAAMVLNLVWAQVLIRVGRARRSPALRANGQHLMSDVWTTIGVLAGLALVMLTGWRLLDPLLAILVALHILREGWKVIFASAGDLMDSAADAEDHATIEAAVRASSHGALQVHDLRTRRAGKVLFIEFHLVVSRDMSVGRAHEICDAMEAAISAALPGARTTIHVEPEELLESAGLHPEPPEN